jgi:hypothetical protein
MFCRPDLDRATWAIQWGVPAGAYRRGRIGYASSGRKVFDHLANVTDDATGPARILLFLLMNGRMRCGPRGESQLACLPGDFDWSVN